MNRSGKTARIRAVGTATPPNRFSQQEILTIAGYQDSRRRVFFLNSEVEGRQLYIEREGFVPNETGDHLHERYLEGALKLGREAVVCCLTQAGARPEHIDFIATTSCTGWTCPGLESLFIRELGMKSRIFRANLLMMGCSSALSALQSASFYLSAHPGNVALVLAVEICSATYFLDDTDETAVANAIFGDGAAAVLLTTGGEGIELAAFEPLLKAEYLDLMGWTQVQGRFRIKLSKEVRRIAPAMIKEVTENLLGAQGLTKQEIRHWVLHSAGRRVLDRAREVVGLAEEDVQASRKILRQYGNLSSATVLFVLDEIIKSGNPRIGDLGVMVALGPGFAAEAALLRWV
jgi:alkylresorcinol/alkylpyrone synthase/polyketide synthase Type III